MRSALDFGATTALDSLVARCSLLATARNVDGARNHVPVLHVVVRRQLGEGGKRCSGVIAIVLASDPFRVLIFKTPKVPTGDTSSSPQPPQKKRWPLQKRMAMAMAIRRFVCSSCASLARGSAPHRTIHSSVSFRRTYASSAAVTSGNSNGKHQNTSPKVAEVTANSSDTEARDDKFSRPVVTDEGVIVHQRDPSTASSGPGLTWGSVLWPSGTTLAKLLAHANSDTCCDSVPDSNKNLEVLGNIRQKRILELGCGTGVVGLTCAKLGARHVTLSDSESALWPIIRKSLDGNRIPADKCRIHQLDWRDPTTFLDPVDHCQRDGYDMVVAADVLYAGMQGLFARVLASHLPSVEEMSSTSSREMEEVGIPEAILACPFRTDSPLLNFFGIAHRLGLELDRLEDSEGNAAGASTGMDADAAYENCHFVEIGDRDSGEGRQGGSRLEDIASRPTFGKGNRDHVQIFRVRRVRGTAAEARAIRRVGRL